MRVSVAGSISPMLYLRLKIWILRLDLYSLESIDYLQRDLTFPF